MMTSLKKTLLLGVMQILLPLLAGSSNRHLNFCVFVAWEISTLKGQKLKPENYLFTFFQWSLSKIFDMYHEMFSALAELVTLDKNGENATFYGQ